jgi:hypothetical protein
MKPSTDELDRLVDALLRETLGNEAAPDLRARILARVPDRKGPGSRRFRSVPPEGNSWMAAAVAAVVFVGLILAALLFSSPEKSAAPTAIHRKPVEKIETPPEVVAPRTPDPVPVPKLEPRKEPDPLLPPPPPPVVPAPKEERKKVDPSPTPDPAPPKENWETRVRGIAKIERAEGDVHVRLGDTKMAPVEILPRTEVMTGPKSRAWIRYPDGTSIEIGPDSVVRDFAEGDGKGKTFFLAKGAVTAEVKKQPADRPMILTTAQGEARVLGTTLRLKVDEKATKLEVVEGKVRLTRLSDSKGVDVVTGHYAVTAGGVELVSRPIAAPRTGTPERPVIVKLQVVSADTGQALLQFDPLEDRMVISLAELPTRNVNIRAVTSPETPGCVVFNYDAETRIEVNAPFLLMGNAPAGKPLSWTPLPGDHALTVTAYSGGPAPNRKEGQGTSGAPLVVRFRIK